MHDPEVALGSDRTHQADRLLVVATALLALLLGCYEQFDTDVWWQLRSGQWILEHRRVPRLDVFGFASAGHSWIEVHWGFQVALATAYALGRVPGMILLASSASSAAFAIAVTARRGDWPGDVFRPLEGPLGLAAGSSWPDADRIAATFLHLGNPQAARRVWSEAADPPSAALRLTRMAGADLAAFDAATAEAGCRQALSLDPRLGEAWYLLTVTRLEAGHVDEALDACRESLKRELTAAQRERILSMQTLLGRRR